MMIRGFGGVFSDIHFINGHFRILDWRIAILAAWQVLEGRNFATFSGQRLGTGDLVH